MTADYAQARTNLRDGWETRSTRRAKRTRGLTRYIADIQESYRTLRDLYETDWLAQIAVRTLPEAAFESDLIIADDEARDAWERMNLCEARDGAFLTAAIWGDVFGKCLLVKGYTYGGPLDQPLPAGLGFPEWLEPIPAPNFTVDGGDLIRDRENPRAFGRPRRYLITGDHRFEGVKIHRSRVVEFVGPVLSEQSLSRDWYSGVQASVLDPIMALLREYGESWAYIRELLRTSSIPVWKIAKLWELLASDKEMIRERFRAQNDALDVTGSVLLDADGNEDYTRVETRFSDLPQLLQQISLQLAAGLRVPVTEIFGRMISGLGESGSEENRRWDRRVKSYQTRVLTPRIRELLPGVKWKFQDLRPRTAAETQTLIKGYWDLGAVADLEVRKAAEADLGLDPRADWTPPPVTGAEPPESESAPTIAPEGESAAAIETPSGIKVELAPTTLEKIMTVNEARKSYGLGNLMRPEGGEDPDGYLPISVYNEKQKAKFDGSATQAKTPPEASETSGDPNAGA